MNVSILTTEGEYLKLCDVKAYLKVSGTDRDGFIVNCIDTAVGYVEKVINKSLLAHTVRYITNADHSFVLPFPNIVSVESVVDYYTSEDVDYSLTADKAILNIYNDAQVMIEYTTEPIDAETFKVATLALISLLYDGITDAEQWNTVLYKYLYNYIPL